MDAWTIEVADGRGGSAAAWRRAHGERLVEAALTHGAKEWTWVVRDWGVLLELTFATEFDWQRFRSTPAVQAALDAAPDPVRGMWVYPGHGGGSGAREPRRPKPIRSAGGAPTPEPEPEPAPWQQPLGRRHSVAALAERDPAAV